LEKGLGLFAGDVDGVPVAGHARIRVGIPVGITVRIIIRPAYLGGVGRGIGGDRRIAGIGIIGIAEPVFLAHGRGRRGDGAVAGIDLGLGESGT